MLNGAGEWEKGDQQRELKVHYFKPRAVKLAEMLPTVTPRAWLRKVSSSFTMARLN